MEHPPFEDVFPIGKGGFPSYVSLPEGRTEGNGVENLINACQLYCYTIWIRVIG